jgi:dipeptidyl aminopeptidase/acylaminoacyl peptidase
MLFPFPRGSDVDELTLLRELGSDEPGDLVAARGEVWRRLHEDAGLRARRIREPRLVVRPGLLLGLAAAGAAAVTAVVLLRAGAQSAAAACGEGGPPPSACVRALAAFAAGGPRAGARRIVFARFSTDGSAQLYSISADGTGLRQLTSGHFRNAFPAWSPNGAKIAFSRSRPGRAVDDSGIFVMNADGSDQRQIATGTPVPAWSPDGSKIAFWNPSHPTRTNPNFAVFVVASTGGAPIIVKRNAIMPAWSPDGSKFAFVSNPAGNGNEDVIETMNANGSDIRILARGFFPAWSPDGTKIAYVGIPNGNHTSPIWVMNADGSHRTQLPVRSWEDTNLAWSPNGKQIAFTNPNGLYLMTLNGHHVVRLTAGNLGSVAW